MSAICSLLDPSLIASLFSPSKETLAILTDFLQTCFFPNYQSLRSKVVGNEEFVRHSGSSTGLSTVKDLSSFKLYGLLVRECRFYLYQL